MYVRCLDLVDFIVIAEAITEVEAEALARLSGLHRAEHALAAPNAGIGETPYYATLAEKAAAMTYQLVNGHPLIDGNKRVGYVCMLDFIRRNGHDWAQPEGDGPERTETVAVFEGLAAGTITQDELAIWINSHLVELTDR